VVGEDSIVKMKERRVDGEATKVQLIMTDWNFCDVVKAILLDVVKHEVARFYFRIWRRQPQLRDAEKDDPFINTNPSSVITSWSG